MDNQKNYINIGDTIYDRFYVKDIIGSGGMGIVYLVLDKDENNKKYAMKIIKKDFDEHIYTRFKIESEIIKKLNHENIVKISFIGHYDDTRPFFIMEYLEGKTLDKILKEKGSLHWNDVLKICIQIADALEYSHNSGVIHRDVKPANLIVGPNNKVTLTDFGLAKILDSENRTKTGTLLGTPQYMSPEQWSPEQYELTYKTDYFSLGVLMYEMLTDRFPFGNSSHQQIMTNVLSSYIPDKPSSINKLIPTFIDDIVLEMMNKNPTKRSKFPIDSVKRIINGDEDIITSLQSTIIMKKTEMTSSSHCRKSYIDENIKVYTKMGWIEKLSFLYKLMIEEKLSYLLFILLGLIMLCSISFIVYVLDIFMF